MEDDRFSEQQTAAPVLVSQLWQWRSPGSISSWGLAADAVARLVISSRVPQFYIDVHNIICSFKDQILNTFRKRVSRIGFNYLEDTFRRNY